MASLVYDSFWADALTGAIDVDAASGIKVMLTTSGYVEAKKTHALTTSVTNEVAAGAGYTTSGTAVTATVVNTTANDTTVITLPGATWTTAAGQTLVARKAVYYYVTGGRLVAVVDFVSDQTASNGGTLTLGASTITINNA